MTTTTIADVASLYRARAGRVGFVDVPELGYLAVDGIGAPEDGAFAEAVGALYQVSYAVHFLVKKRLGEAPKVMPLEALWWVDGDPSRWASSPREQWRWRALMMQPDPIDETDIRIAIDATRAKHPVAGIDRLDHRRWQEGRAAQIMHIGPYSTEPDTIAVLHEAVAAAGYRLRGHHHEIYLGDPRRCAPERLRTILRHPVEPG